MASAAPSDTLASEVVALAAVLGMRIVEMMATPISIIRGLRAKRRAKVSAAPIFML